MHDIGFPGHLEGASLNLLPIDAPEECVVPNLFPVLGSVFGVLLEQPFNEVLAIVTDTERELNLLIFDSVHDLFLVVRVEWREAANHLVNQAAQSVEVHRFVMGVSEEHLRAEVLRRTAKCVRRVLSSLKLFGETEVCKFHVAILTDENILRLQVPVEHIFRMKNFKCLHYFDCVEKSHFFRKLVSLGEEVKQLSSDAEVHYKE